MENMVEDSDGSALDYAQAFMDIGEETGGQPVSSCIQSASGAGVKRNQFPDFRNL